MKIHACLKFLTFSMSETSSSKLGKQITPFRALMSSKTGSPNRPNRSLPTGFKISYSRKNKCSLAAPPTYYCCMTHLRPPMDSKMLWNVDFFQPLTMLNH